MERKGYSLIDILVGLFILGLGVATTIPIINTCFNNLNRVEIKSEMIYIAESVIENIKGNTEEYIEIFEDLEEEGEAIFNQLDQEDLQKYECKIINMGNKEYTWDIKVIVVSLNNSIEVSDVGLRATFPKT